VKIDRIEIQNQNTSTGKVKKIALSIGGLIFYADIKTTQEILLAQTLAEENDLILHRTDIEAPKAVMAMRTWSNQHPNSLDDLDLSFLHLGGKESNAWFDDSSRNNVMPTFCKAVSKTEVLYLAMDHKDIQDRELKNEDRFTLQLFQRIDDGSTPDYEIDFPDGNETLLYIGSNLSKLLNAIKIITPYPDHQNR
jgi:hypothetical protein